MIYAELIAETAAVTNTSKTKVREILDAAIGATYEGLRHGEDVTLGTLGKFVTKVKPERTARNPKTGASIQVPAKTVMAFKVSKTLKDAIA